MKNAIQKIISLMLSLVICFVVCACSSSNDSGSVSVPKLNPDGNKISENIIDEDKIEEDILYEIITEEIYIKEIVAVEDKVTELLIQEETIKEVILCTTIYVPQENITEFSENSQTEQLFGDNIELEPLLTKVAIGTGVIITLTVLSVSGLSGPVASIVAAAAPAAIKGAAMGTLIGGLTGAATGAANQIDDTKRTSAIIGFSMAVVGVVLSTVSAIGSIPSGGSTAAGVAFGIKLAIAGVSLATAAYQGYNMVKTITTTDAKEIDWNNVNWSKVGVSAAEQAINNAADGYVWGSVIGAVEGGVYGYQYYEKFGTPYSSYNDRIARTPVDGERGHWDGPRGESNYVLNEPINCKNGTVVEKIPYHNGVPDFSEYSIRQVSISNMTDNRYKVDGNFAQADTELAKYWTKTKFQGKSWSSRDIANYRTANGLTWHEMNNMHTMQLVPTEVNATWGHLGGVSEYRTMIGQQGGTDFD